MGFRYMSRTLEYMRVSKHSFWYKESQEAPTIIIDKRNLVVTHQPVSTISQDMITLFSEM
jgi:hypothetical protein